MRRRVFAASLFAASMLGSPRAGATSRRPIFAPAQLVHDLDELWHAMLAVGTEPFATSDRATVTARYLAARAALSEPLDAPSFVLAIAPVCGAMNDGHVGVRPDAAFMDRLAVPVRCAVAGNETIVLASAGDRVEPGSRLASLGGISAERIARVTLAGWGGQTPRLRDERFVSACRIVATILANDPDTYDVAWTTPRGVHQRASLPRAEVATPWDASRAGPYTYATVADGTIGVIDYRQCTGPSAFAAFLRRTFAHVRATAVRAMIVDIRNNSGGDSDLNNELWQYLTTKRFTQFGPVVMRASDVLKRLYGKSKYEEIYGPEAWAAPDGTSITYSQEKIGFIEPAPNALRFKGPVALLIGPRTFSSALDCAIAAKDFGLATIVGEETSEPVATTGELFAMSTRFTGITGTFTTKYFKPPKPAPPGRGVVPDIEVRTSLDDLIARRDPVMARAIRELSSRA